MMDKKVRKYNTKFVIVSYIFQSTSQTISLSIFSNQKYEKEKLIFTINKNNIIIYFITYNY